MSKGQTQSDIILENFSVYNPFVIYRIISHNLSPNSCNLFENERRNSANNLHELHVNGILPYKKIYTVWNLTDVYSFSRS